MADETFGAMFKRLRGALGFGLREFCVENGFDPGNISKMERGKLQPPGSREILAKYAIALGLTQGSDEWQQFFDLAAAARGRIPQDICDDKQTLAKMPLLFRALRDKHFTRQDAERLMQMIRGS